MLVYTVEDSIVSIASTVQFNRCGTHNHPYLLWRWFLLSCSVKTRGSSSDSSTRTWRDESSVRYVLNRVLPECISLSSVNHNTIQNWHGYQGNRYRVISNRYSLLPLGRCPLLLTTLKRYISRGRNRKFLSTSSCGNVFITRYWIDFVIKFGEFSESNFGKTQIIVSLF